MSNLNLEIMDGVENVAVLVMGTVHGEEDNIYLKLVCPDAPTDAPINLDTSPVTYKFMHGLVENVVLPALHSSSEHSDAFAAAENAPTSDAVN